MFGDSKVLIGLLLKSTSRRTTDENSEKINNDKRNLNEIVFFVQEKTDG